MLSGPVRRGTVPSGLVTSAWPQEREVSSRDGLGDARRPRLALDVALVPEREGEQAPELARKVLAAGDVRVDQRVHRLGAEEALAAQRVGRQRVVRERLELPAQPRGCRDREAA